jgi:hypothetical protein
VELEDTGVDEKTLEPDYYVDRPPTPEFIPNPAGQDAETQILDHELFDFDLEAEPILEVLCGKSIEEGRIEVLEDWEKEELRKHKSNYEREREAELMEVQRLEAAYNRRVEESERRKLQQEAKKNVSMATQQKLLARLVSRSVLRNLKESSIRLAVDSGALRNPKEQDMHTAYIPHLLSVVEGHFLERASFNDMLQGNPI